MSKDDDRPAGELTDAQLDQVLAAASKGLLYHLEATADPDHALMAIITRAKQAGSRAVTRSGRRGLPQPPTVPATMRMSSMADLP
jgi:hypothetical protein